MSEEVTQAVADPPELPPEAEFDPFDPENMRISADYAEQIGVKKLLVNVPVGKPNRHEYVRVRDEEGWSVRTWIFEDKLDREVFYIHPHLVPELSLEATPAVLYTAITRQGKLFLWPVKLPGTDGKDNPWNCTAREAAEKAKTKWVRMSANQPAGYYDVYEAVENLSPPEWPDATHKEILRLAFRDHYIDSINHPILQRLRGEV